MSVGTGLLRGLGSWVSVCVEGLSSWTSVDEGLLGSWISVGVGVLEGLGLWICMCGITGFMDECRCWVTGGTVFMLNGSVGLVWVCWRD